MEYLSTILLIIHFFSMALGIGVGISIAVVTSQLGDPQDESGKAILAVAKKLQMFARAAIALLWLSGGTMIVITYPDPTGLGFYFFLKIGAVLLLTITIFYSGRLGALVAAGDPMARMLAKRLGMLSGALSTLALIFAVLTFN